MELLSELIICARTAFVLVGWIVAICTFFTLIYVAGSCLGSPIVNMLVPYFYKEDIATRGSQSNGNADVSTSTPRTGQNKPMSLAGVQFMIRLTLTMTMVMVAFQMEMLRGPMLGLTTSEHGGETTLSGWDVLCLFIKSCVEGVLSLGILSALVVALRTGRNAIMG
ncbi:MAG: hypothetical protein M1818_004986 [Claussenomyces sp. TS43310]|nr:MAG: hypothetical protein M1818_004986 [Claussenomyces sp. TS43310]